MKTTFKLRCKAGCNRTIDVEVTQAQVDRWRGGELIQKAMPELSPGIRELFISGTCPDCWDDLFNDNKAAR